MLGRNFVNGKLTECGLLFPAVRPLPKGNINLIPDSVHTPQAYFGNSGA